MCCPRDQRGLGIHDLEVKNTVLLSKRLYKLLISYDIWKLFIHNKYFGSQPLSQDQWKLENHFWASLMKVKHVFIHFGS